MTAYRLIYLTAASRDQALRLAKALVEARLVACANVLGDATSIYWWDGAVQTEAEVVVIAKTRADLVEAAVERIGQLHTYSCPCVVSLPIESGNPAFLAWIGDETIRR